MFSIYTPSGRAFLGSLEELRRVRKSPAYQKISADVDKKNDRIEARDQQDFEIPQRAINEYKSLLEKTGEREPAYHAYQIMSKNVSVLLSDCSFTQAFATFQRYPYQLLPIVSHAGILMGSLSRREIYEYRIELGSDASEAQGGIADMFLTPQSFVFSAEPVTDVRRIASVLVENRLDAVPITAEGGKLTGIVSRTDLLKCLVADPPLSLWC
ncbi:MAG: CBS domain-containing protein [Gammaproteobacteria bacterium]|nr:CBS domain-containing protein [Gammaproteobacteria bacterium]MBT8151192.1 CBS domain-containing protein [Gammaproteobacteria bacterium]NNM11407.1 CBS domain-containing protein [Pseudomonadales bacterium]RZV54739.1 MAG: CBS domain-containing protein [Pseudomonadales bacterium]